MPENKKKKTNLKPESKSPSKDIYLTEALGQFIHGYVTCDIYPCGLS